MDLKHIRTFAAVARVGNLTRAAEHLHLTQPALSLQLKSFQEALDLPLFTRTAQGLAPNADGRALLPSAQRVLDALEDFERAIGALRTTVQGELRLGTILDPEFLRLGATLQYLVQHYPKIRPTLRHGMSGSVGRQVRAGELDVGFFLGPRDAAVASRRCTPCRWQAFPTTWWRPRAGGRNWPGATGATSPRCPGYGRRPTRSTIACSPRNSPNWASRPTPLPRSTRRPRCWTWCVPASG